MSHKSTAVRWKPLGIRPAVYTLFMAALSLTIGAVPTFADSQASDANCVRTASQQLGLNSLTQTDPVMLRDVLENQMFLGDFQPFKTRIQRYLDAPAPLGAFMASIESGIISKHPVFVKFLCQGLQDHLFSDAHAYSDQVKRIVHHTFLLDLLTREMIADDIFMLAVRDHYNKKRTEYDVDTSVGVYEATGNNLFETAKMFSASIAFDQYVDFRARARLTPADLLEKNIGLFANIAEATATDAAHGFGYNMMAGRLLAKDLVKKLWTDGPHTEIKQRLVTGWSELYENWNMAFISGNLSDLDILYPKLLIPCLINAAPEDYLYRRGLALWVSANMVLLRKVIQPGFQSIGPFPKAADSWGKINAAYALKVHFGLL